MRFPLCFSFFFSTLFARWAFCAKISGLEYRNKSPLATRIGNAVCFRSKRGVFFKDRNTASREIHRAIKHHTFEVTILSTYCNSFAMKSSNYFWRKLPRSGIRYALTNSVKIIWYFFYDRLHYCPRESPTSI